RDPRRRDHLRSLPAYRWRVVLSSALDLRGGLPQREARLLVARRVGQHAADDRWDLPLGLHRRAGGGVNLVLDLRPPEGRHYRSWDERLATVARLAQPDAVHALCEQAHAIGVRAVMAVMNPAIREALIEFQRWRDVPIWAVVPNMQAFIRDLTDLGMIGAARARFLRLAPAEMVRQGLRA